METAIAGFFHQRMDSGTGFYTFLERPFGVHKVQNIDLIFVYPGGTTIQSPDVPLLMVTMGATQGLQFVW